MKLDLNTIKALLSKIRAKKAAALGPRKIQYSGGLYRGGTPYTGRTKTAQARGLRILKKNKEMVTLKKVRRAW